MRLEVPRVGEDGDAIWRPNGARQRFAEQMLEEIGTERVFIAIGFLIRRREYDHLPDDEGINLSPEDIANYAQWLDLKDLKLVRHIAETVEGPFEETLQ
jgi:hypothetical protein